MYFQYILLLTVIFSSPYSNASISFGNVQIAEERIEMFVWDFETIVKVPGIKLEAKLVPKTVEWVRHQDVILEPRARISIRFENQPPNLHIKYQDKSLILQSINNKAHIEFYVSLYQPDKIEVFSGKKKIGYIITKSSYIQKHRDTHLIDYSCAKYNVEIKGLENDFLSVGCRSSTIGEFGSEKPMVEILWTSANYKLMDGSKAPYISVFFQSHPIKTKVINVHTGEAKYIEISAKIPKRSHRINTAIGLGPYDFTSTSSNGERANGEIAAAFMLYGKLELDQSNSLRFFDAVVWQKSFFNNLGVYYAYDLALILDRRLLFTALIGVQHVTYRFDSASDTFDEMMLPQGIEMIYKHPFGLKNYSLVLGGFVDPSNSNLYKNVWIRFGKKLFWELNYIAWEDRNDNKKTAAMWGLSVGFPFLSLF